MQIFGNFGDPLREFPERGNLMHEQLGKLFSKTCCENSSAKERLITNHLLAQGGVVKTPASLKAMDSGHLFLTTLLTTVFVIFLITHKKHEKHKNYFKGL